jgi:cyclic dehypoxanthinyl futalosine synthase
MGISRKQALDCFESDDLIGIGMEADAVRRALHPEGVVSYATGCDVLVTSDRTALFDAVRGIATLGGTTVCLRLDAPLALHPFEELLTALKVSFPGMAVQALSPNAIARIAAQSGLSISGLSIFDTLARLRAAGLDAIGMDAEGSSDSLDIHRAAHRAGLRSAIALTFGAGESMADRVESLFSIHDLQEETGGFLAFTAISFKPNGTSSREIEEPTAVEYLRTLAVSRMVLDNIPSIESSPAAQGLKVVQMGLRFGCNDAGTVPPDGGVSEEDLRRVIRDAGFQPVERDMLYRTVFLSN